MNWTKAVRNRAFELGFHQVGFAPAGPADPGGHFQRWLDRGCAGEMDYLHRTASERIDPRVLVEGAKTVVALAISYYWPSFTPEGSLKIARYALGDDYHRVVRKKVRKLRKTILELDPESSVHPSVDTSPVLERAWAERAGIAWIGKSTMAISQRLGTYTFLATLVTSTEFEYDDPHVDRCGTCTRCIEACPSGALVAPYELDARKCISYLTLEHKSDFDGETPSFEGWVAGCDLCQEACPWNRFARPADEPDFEPHEALIQPKPEDFTSEALPNLLRRTALQHTGSERMRRNAKWIIR